MSDQPGPSSTKLFSTPMKKRQKKSALRSSEKTTIINIYKLVEDTWPKDQFWYKKDLAKKTAETAGVSLATVYKVLKQYRNEHRVSSPVAPPQRATIIDKLLDFELSAIRRKVHEFFFRNELPTVDNVLMSVNEDDDLPNFKRTTFQKLLKKLQIKYLKRSRKSALIEKREIVRWRRNYLQKISKMREDGRKIYYTDETWINEGHTKTKVWQDTTIHSTRQAHREGLSTGLKGPSGKGKRLIIVHIGKLLYFDGVSSKY
ncbi:uncharacterized protein LOC113231156 [Hyposmocoma kahamanoa]|uniref:uncharacterized protein LOC113231156 n=1 Tax=Hyposmocoma kahamanoa TaxID=1477025 RepID=UPI000E6D7F96|nr:uncharacterized protein LOC113231156 [Hyposmocoma kahamanoa]